MEQFKGLDDLPSFPQPSCFLIMYVLGSKIFTRIAANGILRFIRMKTVNFI